MDCKSSTLSSYNSEKIYRLVFFFLLIGILLIECIYGMPSFDGAMNLQVAVNLSKNGIYAGNYPIYTLFDEKIQTGIPVLLPIAVLIKLFGQSFAVTLVVNAAYILLLLVVVGQIFKTADLPNKIFYVSAVIIINTPVFFEYGMGVYGEIPTLALFLSSVLNLLNYEKTLKRKYILYAGILMGLAYLTKTVILIGLAGYGVVFLSKLIRKEIKCKLILWWILGFLIPVIVFEAYKFILLGAQEYIFWWKEQLAAIFMQAGVKSGYSDTEGIFEKLMLHFQLLFQYFGWRAILACFAIISGALRIVYRLLQGKYLQSIDIIFITGVCYLIWWLVLTPTEKAWSRRILNGIILLEISFFLQYIFFQDLLRIKEGAFGRLKVYTPYIVRGVLILSILVLFGKTLEEANSIPALKEEKMHLNSAGNKIVEILDQNENAVFCGAEWWQAPLLSYYTKTDFLDFYDIKDDIQNKETENSYYLVADFYTLILGQAIRDDVLGLSDYEQIYYDQEGQYAIYKINKVKNYSEFTETDYDAATLSYFAKDDEQYTPIRGFYEYEEESGTRWAQETSEVLLRGNGGSKLCVEYYIPSLDNQTQADSDFSIYVDEKLVYCKRIEAAGIYKEEIPLSEIVDEDEIAKIKLNYPTKMNTNGDSRELSFCFIGIGFID